MKRIGALILAAVFCGAMVGAALAAGDAVKGQTLAKGCACHRSKADLNGQPAAMLLGKMQAFKAGQGKNTAMISIIKKYSDQDMVDLAAYFASIKK